MAKVKKVLIAVLIFSLPVIGKTFTSAKPQKLKSKIVKLCDAKLFVEIAQTPEQRSTGLMHRTSVPKGTGMLFVFPTAEIRQFWMRNVPFDIDIAYFDAKGNLLNFHTMAGTSPLMRDEQLPRYSSEGAAKFALEVEKNYFRNFPDVLKCTLSPLLVAKK